MSTEQNKLVVRRFIEDVLDGGNTDLILELFAPDCVIRFAHLPEPYVGNATYAAALAPGAANPYIDPAGCKVEMEISEAMVRAILAEQAAGQP